MNRKRKQNEREYQTWKELEGGGRMYWKDVKALDKSGKVARYEKKVDQHEQTLSFVQKIVDMKGKLLEIHEKYPVDKGHIVLFIVLLVGIGILTQIA